MDTLYVVMPAYNEEENMEAVIRQWYPVLAFGSEDSRLVIADSGSVDKTHEIIEGLRENGYPQLVAYRSTMVRIMFSRQTLTDRLIPKSSSHSGR